MQILEIAQNSLQTAFQSTTQVLVTGSEATSLINSTSTIILAVCTALVLFMVPGLAFFYAGLLRKKNVVTMLQQVFASAAIVTVIWVTFGFSLAFGPSQYGLIGDITKYALFRNISFVQDWSNPGLIVNKTLAAGVPFILFFLFQLAFAVITPTLVVGAFADRLTFRGYVVFNILFTIFIYIPACHWIWGGGFLAQWGALDWAGGIVIHATCGLAAVGSVIVLGKRKVLLKESLAPHSIPLVGIGAAILFFGWFGFNLGGATYYQVPNDSTQLSVQQIQNLIQNQLVGPGMSAFIGSFLAMSISMAVWLMFDWIFRKKTSFIGLVTGAIAGLATITPAAGFVEVWAALPIGALGGVITYGVAKIFHHAKFDDALEVFPIHGVGGIVGALILGALVSKYLNPVVAAGHDYGSLKLFVVNLIAVSIVSAWTLIITVISFLLIRFIFLGKLSSVEQIEGADNIIHNEQAYGPEYNISNILSNVGDQFMWDKNNKDVINRKIDNLLANYQIEKDKIDLDNDIYLNRTEIKEEVINK